ncbi:MAG: 6-carboxytetrahydropterin synthase [Gammaproteobacteria bacterium]|nr:6-carboxytetrahydropterin synthase [Gammaproteobacteria bacterium]
MYTVTVREHMMIAHSLPDPFFGPAQKMHGATYVVDAEFSSPTLNQHNVVVDIGAATDALKATLDELNYQNLDELPQFQGHITTTEFLAHYIFGKIHERMPVPGTLKITLNESHVASASYSD